MHQTQGGATYRPFKLPDFNKITVRGKGLRVDCRVKFVTPYLMHGHPYNGMAMETIQWGESPILATKSPKITRIHTLICSTRGEVRVMLALQWHCITLGIDGTEVAADICLVPIVNCFRPLASIARDPFGVTKYFVWALHRGYLVTSVLKRQVPHLLFDMVLRPSFPLPYGTIIGYGCIFQRE